MKDGKKLQRWLGIGAIGFVIIYMGAVVLTVQSRMREHERPTIIESTQVREQERHLMLPELLLPMAILLALAGSYLVVRRRNQKLYERLDDDVDEIIEEENDSTSS
jgi:hypothetical protein